MAISALPFPTPAGVLADASAQITSLHEVLWAARTSPELVGTLEELQVLRSQIAGLDRRLVRPPRRPAPRPGSPSR